MINRFSKMSLVAGLAVAMGAWASVGAATAQTATDASPAGAAADAALVQSMGACGKITNLPRRLACYDALNRSANPAAADEHRAAERKSFGFTTPHLPNPFAAPSEVKREAQARASQKKEDGVDELQTHFDHGARTPAGKLVMVTTEGSVWLLDENSASLDPEKGAPILIRRGALGSLFCDLDRWHAIRCERLQ